MTLFTLSIEGADILTGEALDALYEAGCDDATFGVSSGVKTGEFDREAADFAGGLLRHERSKPARVVHGTMSVSRMFWRAHSGLATSLPTVGNDEEPVAFASWPWA